jgi:hypothetical protein
VGLECDKEKKKKPRACDGDIAVQGRDAVVDGAPVGVDLGNAW